MRKTSRTYRSLVGLVAALAVAGSAGTALAAGRPAGMSPAEYRAMMIRGQALNDMYGLGVPAGMTAQQWRALVVRAQALNDLYAPTAAPSAPAAPVATVSPAGFDWTDAGIGAAIVAGVALLGTGATFGARRAHWHPHIRVS